MTADAYDMLIRMAITAVRANNLAEADWLAREALGCEPARAAGYNVLAAIRELEGKHLEALDLLRAGLAVEPTFEPARHNVQRLTSWPRRGDFRFGDEE